MTCQILLINFDVSAVCVLAVQVFTLSWFGFVWGYPTKAVPRSRTREGEHSSCPHPLYLASTHNPPSPTPPPFFPIITTLPIHPAFFSPRCIFTFIIIQHIPFPPIILHSTIVPPLFLLPHLA
ncbi:hypothetical protein PAPYR_11928 [Paratrimastix pyriformis]|uniref:Uncharacterized protein n=1 Tax=Paratrimastix pyriformis TaxID=342808 RepID=A0ABQ8U2S0_9EUKA|nr:hypothetical protein PAPYR_11928 [Paratrimastix pyriformis]